MTTPNGIFGPVPGARFAEVTDGLSLTAMVGERPPPASLLAGRCAALTCLDHDCRR
ncbi:MAG: DUF1559 family PulG-like putative transporter [Gemmataceae bacterium]